MSSSQLGSLPPVSKPEKKLVVLQDGTECLVIRKDRVSSNGLYKFDTISFKDGSVKPYRRNDTTRQYELFKSEYFEAFGLFSVETEVEESERYSLDWDLTPKTIVSCTHNDRTLFTAFNNFTQTDGFYFYNSSTGHVHEHSGCSTCKSSVIDSSQVIASSISPFTRCAIILKTNKEGRFIKVGLNECSRKYEAMAPLKVMNVHVPVPQSNGWRKIQTVEDVLNVYGKYQVEANKKMVDEAVEKHREAISSLEKECNMHLESLKKMNDSRKEFEVLNAELEKKVFDLKKVLEMEQGKIAEMLKNKEREAAHKKQQEMINAPPVFDFNLFPKCCSFCPHIGQFVITAFDEVTKSTRSYIFSPKTAHFHYQSTCELCPRVICYSTVLPNWTIMPMQCERSKWPCLLLTNQEGRLIKVAFDAKINTFIAVKPSQVLEEIVEVQNSGMTTKKTLEIPSYDTTRPVLYPNFRVYCSHIKDVLINAYNSHAKSNAFYYYNKITGSFEEHVGCDHCSKSSLNHSIPSLQNVITSTSPYTDNAVILVSSKDRSLNILGFRSNNMGFANFPYNVVMLKEDLKGSEEPLTDLTVESLVEKVETLEVTKKVEVEDDSDCLDEDEDEEEYEDEDEEESEEDEDEEEDEDSEEDEDEEEYEDEESEYEDEEEDEEEEEEEGKENNEEKKVQNEIKHYIKLVNSKAAIFDQLAIAFSLAKPETQSNFKEMFSNKKAFNERVGVEFDNNTWKKMQSVLAKVTREDDVESTTTALEPSDIEDNEDAEYTSTALEPSDFEDNCDFESTATAVEPLDFEESLSMDVTQQNESFEGVEHVEAEDDTQSTTTALEPSDIEDNCDVESTTTAVEPLDFEDDNSLDITQESDSLELMEHVEAEDDTKSTTTALEPSDIEDNDLELVSDLSDDNSSISMISSTSTAIEFSIADDSGSSMGSDISYLDRDMDFASDKESLVSESNYQDFMDPTIHASFTASQIAEADQNFPGCILS